MGTWTGLTKNTSTFTGTSINAGSWTGVPISLGATSALLQENGSYILQEDGISKILLEQGSSGNTWTGLTKN